jgi:cytidine deaminase
LFRKPHLLTFPLHRKILKTSTFSNSQTLPQFSNKPLTMPLTPAQQSLIDAANRTIDAVPRGTAAPRITDHTVGCAALCSDGRVFTGINMFHFSGGPCAENIAVANATAAGAGSVQSPGIGGAKLTTIVAVANEGRGVISPCGRCRQLLFDYYPDIQVIIKDGEELRTAGVPELLPFGYISRKFAPYDAPLV